MPLVLVAVSEVLLLRVLMRTGQFLPGAEQVGDLYRGMLLIGTAANNLALFLAAIIIVAIGLELVRNSRPVARLAGVVTIASIGVQIWLSLFAQASIPLAIVALSLIALALALAFGSCAGSFTTAARVVPFLVLLAYLAAIYHAVAQPIRVLGPNLPNALEAFFAAEALATLAAISTIVLVRGRLRVGPALISTGVGAFVLAGLAFQPWGLGLAAMWTFTFSLFLPNVVYALAVAIFTYALVVLWRAPGADRLMAAGLLLIAIGGLKPDYGYYAVLGLAGFWLLVLPGGTEAVPSLERADDLSVRDLSPAPRASLFS
jgi:hypothetical protein